MYRRRYIVLAVFVLYFILTFFMPVYDIECSKTKDSCVIYSRNIITNNREIYDEFKISDIERYRIDSNLSRRHRSYQISIILKSGKIVYVPNRTRTHIRAEQIYNGMIDDDNFVLTGSYVKRLFNEY